MNDVPPIILACLSREPTRYAIDKVCVRSGYQFGTNGHIIARRPFDGQGRG